MPDLLSQGMYYLAPLVKQPDVVPLPKSMYVLPPIVIRKVTLRKESQLDGEACVANDSSDSRSDATAAARVQLSARQEVVLKRLQGLQLQLDQLKSRQPQPCVQHTSSVAALQGATQLQQLGVCHDLVIRASPQCVPYSILVMAAALRDAGCTVQTSSLLHSSLQPSAVPAGLQESFRSSSVAGGSRADHQIVISVVWSDVAVPSLMVSPLHQCPITGEANIMRYLCRLLPATSSYHYEANASFAAIAATDQLLDSCSAAIVSAAEKRATAKFIGSFEARLKSWRAGVSEFGRCGDVGLWSALKQLSARGVQLTPSVTRWLAAQDAVFSAGAPQ